MRKLSYILATVLCISCVNGQQSTQQASKKIDFIFSDNKVSLNTPSESNVTFHYSLMGSPYISQSFRKTYNFDIVESLKSNSTQHNLIAYNYAKDGQLELKIKDNYQLDTTVYIKFPQPHTNIELTASITSGKCLPLVKKGDNDDAVSELKRWLYNNELHLDNEKIEIMKSVLILLKSSSIREYEPKTSIEVPIIKSFSGINYKVNSNMVADYYYLFAGENQDEVEEFIAEVVSSDFPHASKSLANTMNCFRPKNKGGLLYMFLVGINKTWEKQVCPVGMVVIDNIAPVVFSDNDSSINGYSNNEILGAFGAQDSNQDNKITFPKYNVSIYNKCDASSYKGHVRVATGQFRGGNANFNISFGGDVESITIKREIKSSWTWLEPGKKTVTLSGKTSPIHFTYQLDLPIGDNFVPITVKDKRGNVREYSYKITMVAVEDNDPDININNNIWN